MEEERERLMETNPVNVLDYIKSSVEILLSMKEEEMDFMKKSS